MWFVVEAGLVGVYPPVEFPCRVVGYCHLCPGPPHDSGGCLYHLGSFPGCNILNGLYGRF